MATNFIEAIRNTLNFLNTSTGIFILILIVIIIVEALIIWLLIWIIKNQFNKNKSGESNQQVKGGTQ